MAAQGNGLSPNAKRAKMAEVLRLLETEEVESACCSGGGDDSGSPPPGSGCATATVNAEPDDAAAAGDKQQRDGEQQIIAEVPVPKPEAGAEAQQQDAVSDVGFDGQESDSDDDENNQPLALALFAVGPPTRRPPTRTAIMVFFPEAITSYRSDPLIVEAIAKLDDPRVGKIRRQRAVVQKVFVGNTVRPCLKAESLEKGNKVVHISETAQLFLPEQFARVLRLHNVPWEGAHACDRRGKKSSIQVFLYRSTWPCPAISGNESAVDPPVLLVFSTFTKKWRVVECEPFLGQLLQCKKPRLPLVDGQKLFLVVLSCPKREEQSAKCCRVINVYEVDISGHTTVTHHLLELKDPHHKFYLEPFFMRISNYRLFVWAPNHHTVEVFYLKMPSLFTLSFDKLFDSKVVSGSEEELDYNQFMLSLNLVRGVNVPAAANIM